MQRKILLALILLPAAILGACITSAIVPANIDKPTSTPSTSTSDQLLATPVNASADLDAPIPNFLSGKVTAVVTDTLSVKTDIDGEYQVQVLPETKIWKGNWDDNDRVVEVGDTVTISATVDHTAHSAVADQLYVNIVNVGGLVFDVDPQAQEIHFTIQDAYTQELVKIRLKADQKVANGTESREMMANEVDWPHVKHAQVIGLRLKDGTVEASTTFVGYE